MYKNNVSSGIWKLREHNFRYYRTNIEITFNFCELIDIVDEQADMVDILPSMADEQAA